MGRFLFDWSGKTGRTTFSIWLALYLATAVLLFGALADRPPHDPDRRAVLVLFGALALPLAALTVRRLHDTARRGWWGLLILLPGAGALLLWWMCLRPPRPGPPARPSRVRRLAVAGATALSLLIMSLAAWSPHHVAGAGMKPTLLPGDVVALRPAPPETLLQGQVVLMRHPETDRPMVKRLVGLPGDTVQLVGGQLVLNGAGMPRDPEGLFTEAFVPQGPDSNVPQCTNGPVGLGGRCDKARFAESLNGIRYATLDIRAGALDDTRAVLVPAEQVFVLGDNRDNANDSRVPRTAGGPGLVPRDHLVGQVRRVLWSVTGRCPLAFWTLRPERLWHGVT